MLVFFYWASCRIRTNDPEITNHVLWPTELKRRVGKLTISRRYNQLPLLRSSPGGFEGSWPYGTYPCYVCIPFLLTSFASGHFRIAIAKVDIFFNTAILSITFFSKKWNLFLFSTSLKPSYRLPSLILPYRFNKIALSALRFFLFIWYSWAKSLIFAKLKTKNVRNYLIKRLNDYHKDAIP